MPDPTIDPYEARPVVCEAYDRRAAAVARQVIGMIRDQLPRVKVEHVGSTAVPDCAGKGIVDLLIPYQGHEELDAVKQTLDRMGFQHQTGAVPFPEDRLMRVGSLLHDGTRFLLHLHVVPADSPEVEEFLFFRTCLRADPELLRAYVARKREILAGGLADAQDYCRQKAEFIKGVLG